MRLALLLKFTVTCCWVSRQPWVLSITTNGRFIVTDEMYQNTMPSETIDGSTQISKDRYYSTTKIEAILECGKRCYRTYNCHSFLLVPGESKCALTTLDRCSDNENLLFVRPEYDYHELLPENKTNAPGTCYRTCITQSQGNCSKCGRKDCFGEKCDDCRKHCWDVPNGHEGGIELWKEDLSGREWRTCNGTWEQLWSSANPTAYQSTPSYPLGLKFKMNVTYTTGEEDITECDSVIMKDALLSVGSCSGNSTILWEAPFADRMMRWIRNSTCRGFWYPPNMMICNPDVYGIGPNHYAWETPDEDKIASIVFWMNKF